MPAPEPILEQSYWKMRLKQAGDTLHHAIFRCPADKWEAVERKHRTILVNTIQPTASILDVGCGYGRLLSMMYPSWKGGYCGVDLSPDFLEMASIDYPKRLFLCGDVSDLGKLLRPNWVFDWAVMISIRPMVKRNLGNEAWAKMEAEIRKVAHRLLYLEYDENDEGSIE